MHAATDKMTPFSPYSRMGEQECHDLHRATIRILETTGIEVHDEEARAILLAGGARQENGRIQLSKQLVDKALATAPPRMTLHDRLGNIAINAQDRQVYFGGGSDCLNILDHRNGLRRKPRLNDVIDAIKVMDALPEISFVMSMFLPEDVDQRIYDRYQMEVMLNTTTKPIVFSSPDFEGCRAAVEMCEIVAGGAEQFRMAPFATSLVAATSGLVANQEAVQKCMYLARKGLPQLWIPLNAGGVNSPCTTAGCMANMNAGILLGITLAQLISPGVAVGVPGWNGGPYNLKTMVGNYVLADEQGVATDMGRHYNLPVFGLGGATDAKVLDQQCGIETSISLMTALLHGANIVHDVGFMDSGLQGSLQLLVIANETIGFLRAATCPIRVDEETLAVEVTQELGPSGSYLTHPHTLRHFREPFYSDLFDKGNHSQWQKKGALTMEQRAGHVIDTILASHTPSPLPEEVQKAIHAIVAREQKWIDAIT